MAPYRIGIVDYQHTDWQGGRNYVLNLKAALENPALVAPFPFEVVDVGDDGAKRRRLRERVTGRLYFWSGIHQPWLHRAVKRTRCDFAYYCATGSRARVGYRTAHWVADFQSIVAPEFSPTEYRLRSRAYIENVLKDAQRVVLSSQVAHGHCAERYPQFLSKTRVLPFRVAKMLDVVADPPLELDILQRKYEIAGAYFIVCNQLWKNKNHDGVFRAAEILWQKGVEVTVLCTGQLQDNRDPAFATRVLDELPNNKAARRIRMLGKVPVEDLYGLMRHSLAVIQPSFFEGWSTSVEEARCLGKTTLLSDIPVHREQASPYARYFAPDDADALAAIMSELWLERNRPSWDARAEEQASAAYRPLVLEFAGHFLRIAKE